MNPRTGGWIVVVGLAVVLATIPPGTWGAPTNPSAPASVSPPPPASIASPTSLASPPKTTCSSGYPTYHALNGSDIWPLDPDFYRQGPCPLIAQDEVHGTFVSSVDGSASRWTVPWYLPGDASATVGQANVTEGMYLGMVVSGDNRSQWNQSYLELVAAPVHNPETAPLTWNLSLAVLSFANHSALPKGCSPYALNLSWNDSYFCEFDDLAAGVPIPLLTGLASGSLLDATFGGSVGGSGGMDLWVNDSADSTEDRAVTLNETTTGTFAFEPAYSAACADICTLQWGLPYGLGVGVDPCPPSGSGALCDSYDGTAWSTLTDPYFGAPEFWNGTAYAADYRYLEPLSASGVCNPSPPTGVDVATCHDFATGGGTGAYPFFTLNASGLVFGASSSSTLDDFGGVAFEYLTTATSQDLVPFAIVSVTNSSTVGYLGSGQPLDVAAKLVDLGHVVSAEVDWSLAGGAWSPVSMTLTGGSALAPRYSGTIPGGSSGMIAYFVNATNGAGATVSAGPFYVERGTLPHLSVTISISPPGCGAVRLNGTPYPNDSVASLLPGSYSLVAVGCYPYNFTTWSTTPGLTVSAPTVPAGTLTVTANGTLSAAYRYVRPIVTLTISITPSGCGTVTINGSVAGSGTVIPLGINLTYSASIAVTCSGDGFAGWTPSANVSVLGDRVTMLGNGSLGATFIPTSGSYIIAFATVPSTCGGIEYRGAGYTDGETVNATGGSYPIAPLPCVHYGFANFTSTGGLAVSGDTLEVYGGGTLTENNYILTEITVATTPADCGGIVLDGVSYSDGSVIVVANDSLHTISAFSCAGYYVQTFSADGGLTLEGTTLYAAGSGAVSVVSAAGTPEAFVGFETSPSICGTITLGGVAYSNGGDTELPPGTQTSIGATPCAAYGFVAWSLSGDIAVVGTTAWVNGSGSITAVFAPITKVLVSTIPGSCGSVGIGGVPYENGSSAELVETVVYTFSVSACPHEAVGLLETSAEVSVANGSLVTSGPGSVTVEFVPIKYRIGVAIAGAGCGLVRVAGGLVSNGEQLEEASGNYSLSETPCAISDFAGWSTTGQVSVAETLLAVEGSGNVTAVFVPVPPSVSLFAPGSGYAGSAIVFVASIAVPQSGAYSYTWQFGDGTSGVTSLNSTTHAYAAAGQYTVRVTVVDPYHASANATTVVTVISASAASNFSTVESGAVAAAVAAVAIAVILVLGRRVRGRPPPPATK